MWRTLTVAVLCVLALAAPAAARDALQDCLDSVPIGSAPPVCIDNGDGTFSAQSNPGFDDAAAGIPSGFVALFVLVALAGLAVGIYKLALARRMAREAGMDPDEATAIGLLDDSGLNATYVASRVRGTPAAATPPPRAAAERLRELAQLRDEGLVTPEEYEARRRAIVDAL